MTLLSDDEKGLFLGKVNQKSRVPSSYLTRFFLNHKYKNLDFLKCKTWKEKLLKLLKEVDVLMKVYANWLLWGLIWITRLFTFFTTHLSFQIFHTLWANNHRTRLESLVTLPKKSSKVCLAKLDIVITLIHCLLIQTLQVLLKVKNLRKLIITTQNSKSVH